VILLDPALTGKPRARIQAILNECLRSCRFPFNGVKVTLYVTDTPNPRCWPHDPCVIELPESWTQAHFFKAVLAGRARSLSHELFHAWDWVVGTEDDRAWLFKAIFEVAPSDWYMNGVVRVPRYGTQHYWIHGSKPHQERGAEIWAMVCEAGFWRKGQKANHYADEHTQVAILEYMHAVALRPAAA
jgi:hypothetical protein